MSDLSVNVASRAAVASSGAAGGAFVAKADSHGSDGGAVASSSTSKVPSVSDFVTSPKGVVDPSSGVFVLQYRDGDTGEVTKQYPSEKVVAAYRRGAENSEGSKAPAQPVATSVPASSGGAVESAAPAASVSVENPVATSVPTTGTNIGA